MIERLIALATAFDRLLRPWIGVEYRITELERRIERLEYRADYGVFEAEEEEGEVDGLQ